jgi:hypothetical protein
VIAAQTWGTHRDMVLCATRELKAMVLKLLEGDGELDTGLQELPLSALLADVGRDAVEQLDIHLDIHPHVGIEDAPALVPFQLLHKGFRTGHT